MKHLKRIAIVFLGVWILISIYLGSFLTYNKAILISRTFISPQSTGSVQFKGKFYEFELPKNTVHMKGNLSKTCRKYFCLNFNNSLGEYFAEHSHAGWVIKQALGMGYTYIKGNQTLFIIKEKYIRNGYILTYSIQRT